MEKKTCWLVSEIDNEAYLNQNKLKVKIAKFEITYNKTENDDLKKLSDSVYITWPWIDLNSIYPLFLSKGKSIDLVKKELYDEQFFRNFINSEILSTYEWNWTDINLSQNIKQIIENKINEKNTEELDNVSSSVFVDEENLVSLLNYVFSSQSNEKKLWDFISNRFNGVLKESKDVINNKYIFESTTRLEQISWKIYDVWDKLGFSNKKSFFWLFQTKWLESKNINYYEIEYLLSLIFTNFDNTIENIKEKLIIQEEYLSILIKKKKEFELFASEFEKHYKEFENTFNNKFRENINLIKINIPILLNNLIISEKNLIMIIQNSKNIIEKMQEQRTVIKTIITNMLKVIASTKINEIKSKLEEMKVSEFNNLQDTVKTLNDYIKNQNNYINSSI